MIEEDIEELQREVKDLRNKLVHTIDDLRCVVAQLDTKGIKVYRMKDFMLAIALEGSIAYIDVCKYSINSDDKLILTSVERNEYYDEYYDDEMFYYDRSLLQDKLEVSLYEYKHEADYIMSIIDKISADNNIQLCICNDTLKKLLGPCNSLDKPCTYKQAIAQFCFDTYDRDTYDRDFYVRNLSISQDEADIFVLYLKTLNADRATSIRHSVDKYKCIPGINIEDYKKFISSKLGGNNND